MRKLLAALGVSTALMASAALPLASAAEAAMAYSGDANVLQHQIAPVEKAQFFFGGYNYCWYPYGWNGPGYYWCGYAWNRGYGWGGGYGWHGWGGRGRYYGGHPGWGGHPMFRGNPGHYHHH
ncbi:MAG: hypothetical protein ABSC25_14150 [Roseiarcus sp.]|jgi:hypothetical protein